MRHVFVSLWSRAAQRPAPSASSILFRSMLAQQNLLTFQIGSVAWSPRTSFGPPLRTAGDGAKERHPRDEGSRMTGPLLVIDDGGPSCELVKTIFTHEGIDVIAAHNGASGLERAGRDRPLAVLLDLGLPDL